MSETSLTLSNKWIRFLDLHVLFAGVIQIERKSSCVCTGRRAVDFDFALAHSPFYLFLSKVTPMQVDYVTTTCRSVSVSFALSSYSLSFAHRCTVTAVVVWVSTTSRSACCYSETFVCSLVLYRNDFCHVVAWSAEMCCFMHVRVDVCLCVFCSCTTHWTFLCIKFSVGFLWVNRSFDER